MNTSKKIRELRSAGNSYKEISTICGGISKDNINDVLNRGTWL